MIVNVQGYCAIVSSIFVGNSRIVDYRESSIGIGTMQVVLHRVLYCMQGVYSRPCGLSPRTYGTPKRKQYMMMISIVTFCTENIRLYTENIRLQTKYIRLYIESIRHDGNFMSFYRKYTLLYQHFMLLC